ncbi:hypothetical protein WJX73_005651 [Symbiochloris irregularis]|uniref:Uncharacterized protein n=1 Tax=Symbiochloris irregularis TaxID=706552 RepID=A0AAW1PY47_9CHLO
MVQTHLGKATATFKASTGVLLRQSSRGLAIELQSCKKEHAGCKTHTAVKKAFRQTICQGIDPAVQVSGSAGHHPL